MKHDQYQRCHLWKYFGHIYVESCKYYQRHFIVDAIKWKVQRYIFWTCVSYHGLLHNFMFLSTSPKTKLLTIPLIQKTTTLASLHQEFPSLFYAVPYMMLYFLTKQQI